jgi:hypothetical protein
LRFATVSALRIHSRRYRNAELAEANGATRAPESNGLYRLHLTGRVEQWRVAGFE